MKELKEFLALRDTLAIYESLRGKSGRVGIPMISVSADGQAQYYLGLPEDISLLK